MTHARSWKAALDSCSTMSPRRRREDRTAADGSGMSFDDFCEHPHAQMAQLTRAHVLAIRLYSTAAFKSLNTPLRNRDPKRAPHPYPVTTRFIKRAPRPLMSIHYAVDDLPPCVSSQVTILFIKRAIKKMCSVEAKQGDEEASTSPTTVTATTAAAGTRAPV